MYSYYWFFNIELVLKIRHFDFIINIFISSVRNIFGQLEEMREYNCERLIQGMHACSIQFEHFHCKKKKIHGQICKDLNILN